MAVTIDNLQIEIQSQSTKATSSLMRLIDTLKDLKAACAGGAGLGAVVKQLERLNKALNGQGVSNSFDHVSRAAKKATDDVKNYAMVVTNYAASVRNASKAAQEFNHTAMTMSDGLKTYTQGPQARLNAPNNPLGSFNDYYTYDGGVQARLGGSSIPLLTDNIIDADWKEVADSARQAGESISGLADAAKKVDDELPYTKTALGEVNQANIDMLKSTMALQSPLGKLASHFSNIAKKSKLSGKSVSNLFSSLKRIAMYRLLRTALKEIGKAFSEGLSNAYQYSKIVGTELAPALDHLASVNLKMKNQLGALSGQLLIAFMPLLTRLIDFVTKLADRLTEVMAALNGNPTYQKAKDISTVWEDATDSVKEYKQQLLGLDELNVLSTNKNGKGDNTTPIELMYEDIPVSDSLKWLGEFKISVKDILFDWDLSSEDILGQITDKLNVLAGAAIGFEFGGLGGALLGIISAVAITGLVKSFKTKQAEDASVGLKSLGLTTVLSGIVGGLIGFKIGGLKGAVIGATLSMSITSLVSSVKLKNDSHQDGQSMAKMVSSVLTSIAGAAIGFKVGGVSGAIIGASIGLALGLLVNNLKFNDQSHEDSQSISRQITDMLNHTVAGLAGAVLGFKVGGLGGAIIGFSIGTSLSLVITDFEFVNKIKQKVSDVADTLVNDTFGQVTTSGGNTINFSPTQAIGNVANNLVNNTQTPRERANNLFKGTLEDTQRFFNDLKTDFQRSALGQLFGFADGGMPTQGTLFYAGESGPEFVGSMGGRSAVANTDQMSEAIEMAAYRGVSRAMQENNNTVVLSPDADKIFNITREKGREYTRMTGQSWAY